MEECQTGSKVDYQSASYGVSFGRDVPPKYFYIDVINDGDVEYIDPERLKIKINPIECMSVKVPGISRIACGNGYSTSSENKCLYNTDDYGSIIGCGSMEHLQNCASFACPDNYFKCPDSFCIEDRFVCDKENHCENGEDEQNCESRLCTSQFKCLKSSICLNNDFICDGVKNCPLGDDERLCNFRCIDGCRCHGLTMDCGHKTYNSTETNTDNSSIAIRSMTRFLDLNGNPRIFNRVYHINQSLSYLINLNISFCGLSVIRPDFFQSMKNLRVLDISFNRIRILQANAFIEQNKLLFLRINGNFEILLIEQGAFTGLSSLHEITITHVRISHISQYSFDTLDINTLDLSSNTINSIENNAFGNLKSRQLYLNTSQIISFDAGMFNDFGNVQTIVTEAYKFCCIRPSELPEENCYPHKDEFSSCSDLMRNEVLRSLIWILGLLALIGNGVAFIYRVTFDRKRMKLGYGIFVTNLAVSDFMMGLYLIIVASADAYYRGIYIYNDESWKTGALCQFAGVLSALSSEAAVLFITLITIDRILVIKFPFGDIKFSQKNATIASICAWTTALLISIFPLTYKSYFKGLFYSKSGVCLALPLTRDKPPGWVYSISIFIGFNFVTFVLIAFGQWLIYWEVHEHQTKIKSTKNDRSNDLRISRNLLMVVATDFLCWFPIGILGLIALNDHVIPGEVYAWTAVFVLPVNSAMNPFLYTATAVLNQKKFAPDVFEQARTQVYLKGDVENIIEAWKSRLYFIFKELRGFYRIKMILNDDTLTRQQCFRIICGIAKCMEGLHSRELVQKNFSMNDIYVRKLNQIGAQVALNCRPKLATGANEKTDNMEVFGRLLTTIMRKCNRPRKSGYRKQRGFTIETDEKN